MLVLIKGAGDLASGVASRLYRSGFSVVMTDLPQPTAIRRTVSFCEAIPEGSMQVEGIVARRAMDAADAKRILEAGEIPVLADEKAECRGELRPDVVVDAILAKRNLGTKLTGIRLAAHIMTAVRLRTRGFRAISAVLPLSAFFGRRAPGHFGRYTQSEI